MDRKKNLLKVFIVLTGFLITSALGTSTALASLCLADINGDGKVDFRDAVIMKTEMGREDCYKATCQADLNGDGKVNNKDNRILKAELGRDDCTPGNGDVPREDLRIPQSGQDIEFDTDEDEEEEEEEVRTYETGEEKSLEEGTAPPATRFKDNGDETVVDPKTGLMWTKDANLPGDTMLFYKALDYIEEMNEGEYSNFNYTDWRLPTLKELRSLIDYTGYVRKKGHELPSGHPFQNVQSLKLNDRSSVTYLSITDHLWFVSFYCRLIGHNVKSCYGYVWPVRGKKVD